MVTHGKKALSLKLTMYHNDCLSMNVTMTEVHLALHNQVHYKYHTQNQLHFMYLQITLCHHWQSLFTKNLPIYFSLNSLSFLTYLLYLLL